MAKSRSAAQLARDWRKEQLDFNEAVIQHLAGNLGLVPDPALVVGIGMAVSWANMRMPEAVVDLPGYPQMTAGEIVEKFDLKPFLESTV